jgi:hypothetical protein
LKITALPEIFRFTNRVQEKPDGQGAQGEQRQPPEQERKQEDRDATPEEVNEAIALFQSEPQTREAGLKAEASGTGPGLRVTLRDNCGTVVRQFTGEEFVKLREAATQDARNRGKILDQKF